ncbi:membrane protein insertase YidC [Candidatus Peregrinibacteria bacterium]|nr:membrane protein insertase YidC [Candidatus Peregrinibacteria bacterium]
MNKNILLWLVIFLSTLLLIKSFGNNKQVFEEGEGLGLNVSQEIARGKRVNVTLKNFTLKPITIKNDCPKEPLDVTRYENSKWITLQAQTTLPCEKIGFSKDFILEPNESKTISYDYWDHELFQKLGRYQISTKIEVENEIKTFSSNEFVIKKESLFQQIWNSFFFRPIYNTLIFFAKFLPFHSLGASIILITILIRSILLLPSQRAMRAQKKLQEIQPKLEKIRKKYATDQQKLAMETMTIWKENKVNPLTSCLPIIIQMPILIGLFYAVRNGINPDKTYLLYEPLKSFNLSNINTLFLGILDLTKNDIFVLPIVVGLLQFIQMKLSMAKKAKKKEEPKKEGMPDMEIVTKSMTYFMPIMIAVFTITLPAGVGLYWGVSTLYGIGQQWVINKESKQSEPDVVVVEKK